MHPFQRAKVSRCPDSWPRATSNASRGRRRGSRIVREIGRDNRPFRGESRETVGWHPQYPCESIWPRAVWSAPGYLYECLVLRVHRVQLRRVHALRVRAPRGALEDALAYHLRHALRHRPGAERGDHVAGRPPRRRRVVHAHEGRRDRAGDVLEPLLPQALDRRGVGEYG